MDLTKYYPDIAAKYPAYVTQRELCEICRICPKTAYNLEQQGEIPYTIEQNHLIRSHKIKLTDILAYEIPVFHKALSECGSLEVRPVAICVPQEIQEYCMELFGEDVQVAAASHDLFAKRANGQIYRPLVEKYIAGEKRL